MKRMILLSAFILSSSALFAQQVPYENVSEYRDTVSSGTYYFVGKTDPKAAASVNGKPVHVYKTGAFGDTVQLKEGDNTINISLTLSGKTFTTTEKVFRKISSSSSASSVKPQDVNLTAKVKGKTAYFQFGNGDDRLGGSKMSFISEGVALKLEQKEGSLYKARLSDNRFAYIDEENLDFCDVDIRKVNSGSIRVSNVGKQDRVSISLGAMLPYSSRTEFDPTKIIVDVYGAMNNSNWITHSSNLEMIEYVDVVQTDSDMMSVVIALKHKYAWGYSIGYEQGNLVIKVKHTPSTSLKDLTIGLDAGHGKVSCGAVSSTGLTENVINMKLVNLVMDLLQKKGAKVVRTRTSTEQDLTMTERKKILSDADVDLLVSIHNNAGGSPFVPMGTSTYYKYIVNRELAESIYRRMLELGVADYGITGNFNFSLCAPTEYPDVLLEAMFMSSLLDEEKLYDDAFCNQVAQKVVLALEDYLKKVYEADVKPYSKKRK